MVVILRLLSLAALAVSFTSATTPAGQDPEPSPAASEQKCPRIMCIDGINTKCGQRWGGCYDTCKPELRPTMPACPDAPTTMTTAVTVSVTTTTTTSAGVVTAPPKPASSGDCKTRTVCIDYVNECGRWYGG